MSISWEFCCLIRLLFFLLFSSAISTFISGMPFLLKKILLFLLCCFFLLHFYTFSYLLCYSSSLWIIVLSLCYSLPGLNVRKDHLCTVPVLLYPRNLTTQFAKGHAWHVWVQWSDNTPVISSQPTLLNIWQWWTQAMMSFPKPVTVSTTPDAPEHEHSTCIKG